MIEISFTSHRAAEGEMMKTAAMERGRLDRERIDLENELAEVHYIVYLRSHFCLYILGGLK